MEMILETGPVASIGVAGCARLRVPLRANSPRQHPIEKAPFGQMRSRSAAGMAKGFVYAGCLLIAGCAAPFGVRYASPKEVHRSLTANELSTGELSNVTQVMLRRQNKTEAFQNDPAATLLVLRATLLTGGLPHEDLFSLAELSFHYAERGGGKPHYLASAVYAYAYLFPKNPDAFDPRLRDATDLYNQALTQAFKSADGEHVEIAAGTFALPFGQIEVGFDERQLLWGTRRLHDFSPAAEVEVIGFRNRYRQPGIGAALAAATERIDPNEPVESFVVGPHVRVPVTALLRLPDPSDQVLRESLTAELELHPSTDEESVDIGGRSVPLEQEPTAALALALNEGRPWATELGRFLGEVSGTQLIPTRLGGLEPHRHGQIPIVFVHGTASNFSVWANMINDLDNDPVIRQHFEYWFLTYDSGQPILYSASQLRLALTATVSAFQATDPDPCLDKMVVVGHSQGGLLTKLTAIHSGDLFWPNWSRVPVEQANLSDQTRAMAKEVMFVEPLPFVRRVIFIATPQRGSYLASAAIVRRLAERLISLPASLASAGASFLRTDVASQAGLQRLPTSIDNMSPGHPFIVTIAKIPVDPRIAANSIIGVTDPGNLETGGDGVVKYKSAHIESAESELVVPYEHSMQSKPEVVGEVQRILHHHLELNSCAAEPTHPSQGAVRETSAQIH